MDRDKVTRIADHAGKVLQQAVREAMEYKAKMGQFAIVGRNGKPCRVPASELLKELNAKEQK